MLTGHIDHLSRSEFVGWAADLADPDAVVPVVVRVNGRLTGRIEAKLPREDLARLGQFGRGEHGFSGRFTPPLPAAMAYTVSISFEADGAPLVHGQARFYPDSIPKPAGAISLPQPLRPLLVTSLGRSGSTLLMHRLRAHPHIVVPGETPYENRVGAYYANVYRVLTAFDDPAARTDPNHMATMPVIGALPFDSAVQRFPGLFRRHVPNIIAACAREAITLYYASEAASAQRTASLFAEKCNVSGDDRAILRSLFPDLLEIVLVRDLRDLYCSSRAFWELDEPAGLGRLSQARAFMLAMQRERPAGVLLLRYEDLLRQPAETEATLRHFLDIGAPFSRDEQEEASLFETHATAANPETSIERWRHEILPASVRAFMAESEEFNRAFGYRPL
jgi:hypothetical protein